MSESSCKQNCDETSAWPAKSLYLHIPFCVAKCRYCDFYSLPLPPEKASQLVSGLLRELALRRGELAGGPLETLFVGGGTPTALGAQLLRQLLSPLRDLLDEGTEFSVEANPGTFDEPVAAALREAGVNRLNFGVQSFQTRELSLLGRIHNAGQARQAIAAARTQGFGNLGLDLIYGVPGQSVDSWRDNLRQALDLGIEHLSCYALSFEHGTPLLGDLIAGKVQEMPEQEQRACYEAAIELSNAAGLEHYEISNFARPGRPCRHNLTYWHNRTYLGLGPSAASYTQARRRTNARDLVAYIEAVEAGQLPPAEIESLPPAGRMAETAMLGLRLIQGLDRQAFRDRFGMDATEAFPQSLHRYIAQKALLVTPTHIRLATWALFAADTILADIVSEIQK